jgi:tRNA threonylcarbamoyladenosine biosynthesis protein TsaE
MKESFVATEDSLKEIAKKITETLAHSFTGRAKVLFLEGDLGAGKTTFTKEIAEVLGIDKEDVHSPTFILKKEYISNSPLFKKLVHIDAYRFESKDEAKVLKLDKDRQDHETLIVIEWPSKLEGVIGEDMVVTFSVLDDEKREVLVNYTSVKTSGSDTSLASKYFRV